MVCVCLCTLCCALFVVYSVLCIICRAFSFSGVQSMLCSLWRRAILANKVIWARIPCRRWKAQFPHLHRHSNVCNRHFCASPDPFLDMPSWWYAVVPLVTYGYCMPRPTQIGLWTAPIYGHSMCIVIKIPSRTPPGPAFGLQCLERGEGGEDESRMEKGREREVVWLGRG